MQVDDDELDAYLDGLRNYGSLFLGREATVAYGDKAVGTNHVLPTARRRALYRRPLGRQVPEDGDLPAPDATRARVASPLPRRRSATRRCFAGHALTARMRHVRRATTPRGAGD